MTRFEVYNVGVTLARSNQVRFDDEADAVLAAVNRLGDNVTHVIVEAHEDAVDTFGVRHLRFVDGKVTDSGWRCWIDGVFVGGASQWALRGCLAASA